MPHLLLEYSDNIADRVDVKKLFKQLNEHLASTGLFSLNDIKSRAIKHDIFLIGDGDRSRSFVTVNLAILSGRPAETKKQLSDGLLEIVRSAFPKALTEQKTSLTVQISDLDSYGRIKSYDD